MKITLSAWLPMVRWRAKIGLTNAHRYNEPDARFFTNLHYYAETPRRIVGDTMLTNSTEKHILDFKKMLTENREYIAAFFRKVKAVRYFSTMICIGLLILVWGELSLNFIGSALATIFLASVIAASKHLACLVSGVNRFSSLEVVTVAKQYNYLSGLRSLLGNNKRLVNRREVSKLLTMSEKGKFDIYNYLNGMAFLADNIDTSSVKINEEDTEINY